MRYLIPLFDHQINGKLCAHDGKIMVILPNYTRVFPEADGFAKNDGSLQVYLIEVKPDLVAQVKNGDVVEHMLWKGPKNERINPLDHLTCPIYSLTPGEAAPAAMQAQASLKAE